MKNTLLYLSLIFCLEIFVFISCSEEDKTPWQGDNYIHFAGGYQDFYSFVYAGSSVERDTLTVALNIAGHIVDYDRSYKVKQVTTYGFLYEEDEFGNRIDSAFIELPNQAIPGVHYVDFASYEPAQLIVPADSLTTTLDIILLKDSSLQENNYSLSIEVEGNDHFLPGYSVMQRITLTLSAQIIMPKLWEDRSFVVDGGKALFEVLGYYGKVKHQLLIDVTGQRWDDDFIKNELTGEYLVFYRNMAVLELNKINEERAAEGLHPLREDDSNPNSEVKFF